MSEDLSLPYQKDYKHREDETILAHLDDLGVGWCWNEKVRTLLPPSSAAGPLSKSSIWFLIFDETRAFWNNWKEWDKNLMVEIFSLWSDLLLTRLSTGNHWAWERVKDFREDQGGSFGSKPGGTTLRPPMQAGSPQTQLKSAFLNDPWVNHWHCTRLSLFPEIPPQNTRQNKTWLSFWHFAQSQMSPVNLIIDFELGLVLCHLYCQVKFQQAQSVYIQPYYVKFDLIYSAAGLFKSICI